MVNTTEFRDWRGRPIDVGDIVVYPTRKGSKMQMHEGRVVSLGRYSEDSLPDRLEIGVNSGGNNAVVYPDPSRVTVVVKPGIR